MFVNEFESKLPQDGYNQFSSQVDTTEDEEHSLKRADSWHLLFPEIVQDVSTLGNSSDKLPISHQDDNAIHDSNLVDISPVISIDAIDEEAPPLISIERSGFHRKSFSLFSDASSEDVILLDVGFGKEAISSTSDPLKYDDIHPELKYESSSSSSTNHVIESRASNLSNKSSSIVNPSPMHKPPTQVMERDDGYDPQRIPSSVFARNDSVTPGEWSLASNESLFSLHFGNASIDREQALLLSGELNKLTGLTRSEGMFSEDLKEELSKPSGVSKSAELYMSSPPPPSIHGLVDEDEVPCVKNLDEIIVQPVEQKKKNLTTTSMKTKKEMQQHRLPSTRSSSVSHQSDASEESNRSFAFPILSEAEKIAPIKGHNHLPHPEHPQEAKNSSPLPPPYPSTSSCFSCFFCFSCSSCFSRKHRFFCDRFSYRSWYSRNSCSSSISSSSCCSCKSCWPKCGSCKSCWPKCGSCKSCWPKCGSCKSLWPKCC